MRWQYPEQSVEVVLAHLTPIMAEVVSDQNRARKH